MKPQRSVLPFFLLLGIASGIFLKDSHWSHLEWAEQLKPALLSIISFCLLAWGVLVYLASAEWRRKMRTLLWLAGILLVSMASGLNAGIANDPPGDELLRQFAQSSTQLYVMRERPKFSDPGLIRARIIGADSINGRRPLKKVLVDLRVPVENILQPGDTLIARSALQRFRSNVNPGEFNYAEFMAKKHIYFRVKLNTGAYSVYKAKELDFGIRLTHWRERLLKRLDALTDRKEDAAIIQALLFGERSGLDKDVKSAFRDNGVSHLLAVSGMHVGLVYALLFVLIGRLKYLGVKKKYLEVSMLPLIWIYAMLTGFGPSVMRAVLLITTLQVVRLTGRRVRSFHTLCVCLFILLIAEPQLLFDLGFQLSALATMGIIVFAIPLMKLCRRWPAWIRWPVQLSIVSLAAQLMVAPLIIFHFHQFQLHFLLTNLVFTPVVTLMMYGGSALLVLGDVSLLGTTIAGCIHYLNMALNEASEFFADFHRFRLLAIPLEESLVWWYFIVIFSIVFLVEERGKNVTVPSIMQCVIFVLMGISIYERIQEPELSLISFEIEGNRLHVLRANNQVFHLTGAIPDRAGFRHASGEFWMKRGLDPNSVYDQMILLRSTLVDKNAERVVVDFSSQQSHEGIMAKNSRYLGKILY